MQRRGHAQASRKHKLPRPSHCFLSRPWALDSLRRVLYRHSIKMPHLITTALCWQSIYNHDSLDGSWTVYKGAPLKSPDHSWKPWGVWEGTPGAIGVNPFSIQTKLYY